ncbi:hypothetical protein F3Y22_tig00111278pilonHSYRG00117 [Hibiscus syriacus]|uniref:3-methyl-2-oxobutanoate hydroxymethyltransferase n=1 Tax=Hibiscus syriacus TaxID=106335 RepID=A0A6A2YRI5_HIBSY|nr:hypothetical protein F3Y22_tig00111278pilonHSYRG00117 [Hibiscus syriacus]
MTTHRWSTSILPGSISAWSKTLLPWSFTPMTPLSLSHSTKCSSIAVQSLTVPRGHYSLVTCHLGPMRPASVRVLKMDAIKLEGGFPSRISVVKVIVEAGITVIGHVGLTPQAISVLGGFRPQGKNVTSAVKVVETPMALQEVDVFWLLWNVFWFPWLPHPCQLFKFP